jgi:pyruvate formate lyase activating enzyme
MRIGGYQPVSLCDFAGHVAAVVFTQGCNFRCPFCHNAGLLPVIVADRDLIPEKEILQRLERRRGQIDAVVVSGGEPTLQPDLPLFLRALRAMGFTIKLDTNGSKPEVLGSLIGAGLLDYVAMDVKAPWDRYQVLAGVRVDTNRIAESLRIIAGSAVPHEFRTTWVRPLLSEDDIETIRRIIPLGSPYKQQDFRPGHALAPNLRDPDVVQELHGLRHTSNSEGDDGCETAI